MSSGIATIVASFIAGLSLLVSGFLAWKLKSVTDQRTLRRVQANERHAHLRKLYEGVFSLFERAIRERLTEKSFTLSDEFTKTNAAIHLVGSDEIVERYSEACSLFHEWSLLHAKASPEKMKFGDETLVIVKSPDPAREFQEPARAAYEELQAKLKNLVALMRWELEHGRT